MEINSLAGYFFGITVFVFFFLCVVDRTLSRPFCPNLRFCFARVDLVGLRAWSDDLNVVLFDFLEDDTKLAQCCTDWSTTGTPSSRTLQCA